MFGKTKSPEFIAMQKRDKTGPNNPQFGVIKSADTIAKLTKLVYVYNAADFSFIGEYPTRKCINHFHIGSDTLTKYLKNGKPFKGLLFCRSKFI